MPRRNQSILYELSAVSFRLKNWIAQQAEREREAREHKRRKLERLREEPKYNFHDQTYEKERSQLTEKISDAVEQGTSSDKIITEVDILNKWHCIQL
jgi:hypothetical protein